MLASAASDSASLLDATVNAGISAAVGLAVGVIAFPVRWFLQWRSRLRQENVSAYRDALRLLRSAQREARYGPRESDGHRNRDAVPGGAWEAALHRLAEAPDESTYRMIERLAALSEQSRAISQYFPPGAGEDPRGELAEHAVELLTHQLKHRWRRFEDIEDRLTLISDAAVWAEDELDAQYKREREACTASLRKERASAGTDD